MTCLSPRSLADHEMHFFLPDFPPYTTVDSNGDIVGIGIDKVLPILEAIEVNYTLEVGSNHGRALSELKLGRSDGMFMASQNDERDRYAVFSESVMTNRWVWVVRRQDSKGFQPSSPSFRATGSVTSLLNTNTHYWLMREGYNVAPPANDIRKLVQKLNNKEVDAIMVAEVVLLSEIEEPDRYQIVLQEAKEFGIYVSKEYLEHHPNFMKNLNRAILQYR